MTRILFNHFRATGRAFRLRCLSPIALVLFFLGPVESEAAFASRANTTTGFADASVLTRTITFTAADFNNRVIISDVDLTVSFAKSNNNSFVPQTNPISTGLAYFDEIEFVLFSPSGTSVRLISNAFGNESFNVGVSNGFQGTITFDQSATTRVNADRERLFSGTFLPASPPNESLNSFNGETAVGTWTLTIGDDVGLDGLSFYSASLAIHTLPEPDSVGLWGTFSLIFILALTYRSRRHPPRGIALCHNIRAA